MKKHHTLIIHTNEPFNAEPPLDALGENFITPQDLFYVRNHGDIPEIDADSFRLHIDGLAEKPREFSLQELQTIFPKISVMATVQCAGNRRTQLMEVKPVPGEVPWQDGAIGNTTWSGAPLKDVLNAVGIKPHVKYVAFMGMDKVIRNDENVGFGASIPVEKATKGEVLLAYEMNNLPLEPIHGFPLRVIVPGYIGARSVKWLSRITLQEEPSKNYFQAHAYQLFPPFTNAETADWNNGLQLSEAAVNCIITSPKNDSISSKETVIVKGLAVGSGGRKIARVDLSSDGGNMWTAAAITQGNREWAWSFWQASLKLKQGKNEIIARAVDSGSNTQPEDPRHIWNFKGYMNNAWHRVRIDVI